MGRRRLALLFTLVGAGCGQVIGIRELGVEALPAVDSVPPPPDVDRVPPPETNLDAGADDACSQLNLAGHWRGSFTATAGNAFAWGVTQTSSQGDLQQQCTTITGSISIDRCVDGGKLLATIEEDGGLDGTLTKADIVMRVHADLAHPNQLDGNFTLGTNSSCNVPSGTFQLYRQ